jgi:hypothetical protein
MTKEKKISFDTNTMYFKILKSLSETKTKGYETFYVIADDDDNNSIHTADIDELATIERDRVFISENKIKDFVNQLLEQRLGSSLNNKDE